MEGLCRGDVGVLRGDTVTLPAGLGTRRNCPWLFPCSTSSSSPVCVTGVKGGKFGQEPVTTSSAGVGGTWLAAVLGQAGKKGGTEGRRDRQTDSSAPCHCRDEAVRTMVHRIPRVQIPSLIPPQVSTSTKPRAEGPGGSSAPRRMSPWSLSPSPALSPHCHQPRSVLQEQLS